VRLRIALFVLVASVVGMFAGCGSSERGSDAAVVAVRFHTAIGERDGMAACSELSEETATALEQQEGHPCDEAILDLDLAAGGELADASVYVTSASVSLRDGGTLFLDEASDGWEISAAGCRPSAPDRPLDCELED
jgi:hypothetical protein